jgi:signal transduction histidine kinase
VLEPFARGEASRNRQTGGTGLGLAIARAVAEGHGGTLTLANGGPGLVATMTLPG